MIKRLTKHGESWTLDLDSSHVRQLNLAPNSEIVIEVVGNSLVIRGANLDAEADDARQRNKLLAACEAIELEHESAFRKLAE